MMKSCLCLILLIFIFSACERTVDFKLDAVPPKLVVEATIENDQPPIVYLSKSLAYFSRIDPDMLAENFVHNAQIIVSNGTKTHVLKEYAVPVGNGTDLYYYSIDSADLATAFLGELNTDYTLRITWEGEDFTATTHIPNITRQIDSLYWKPAPPGNDPEDVSVMLKATDVPGFGDYVRYFTRRNSEPFYPGLNSVFDDQVIDGSSYDVQVERGVDRNADRSDHGFFERGDTVTLKLSNIDKATFDFWRTMEFTYSSVGNPFSSPTKVISNISNGALGYFGGYASQYRSLVIPL